MKWEMAIMMLTKQASLAPSRPAQALRCYFGPRTVRTGTGDGRTIISVTLPSNARERPRRPCVPITIKSALISSAVC